MARNKVVVTTAPIVCLFICIFLVGCQAPTTAQPTIAPSPTPLPTETALAVATEISATETPVATESLSPTPSLADGAKLLFANEGEYALTNIEGSEFTPIPAPSPALGTFGTELWAPNNHFMVYGGATDGESLDLYAYDALTGETRLLTDDSLAENPIAFSPTGEYLIYLTAESISYEGATLSEVRAYAFKDSTTTSLYTPEQYASYIPVFGWADEQTALLATGFFEASNRGFRKVNVATGEIQVLSEDSAPNRAALNPQSGILMSNDYFGLNPQEAETNPPSEFNTLNLITNERGTITVPSEWGNIQWFQPLQLFATQTATETHFFEDSGTVAFSIPCNCDQIEVSPDGAWVAARINQGWTLFDASGTEKFTVSGATLHWLPTGTGFIVEETDGENKTTAITSYDSATEWQPQPLPVGEWEGMKLIKVVSTP